MNAMELARFAFPFFILAAAYCTLDGHEWPGMSKERFVLRHCKGVYVRPQMQKLDSICDDCQFWSSNKNISAICK